MNNGEIIYYQPHLISKIFYEFGGLISKTALCFKKDVIIHNNELYDKIRVYDMDMFIRCQNYNAKIFQFSIYHIGYRLDENVEPNVGNNSNDNIIIKFKDGFPNNYHIPISYSQMFVDATWLEYDDEGFINRDIFDDIEERKEYFKNLYD
mgnify:CR=1 FL=1